MTTKLLNQHQTKWVEVLSVYNFVLSHHSEKMNPTNAPSCWANYAQEFHGEILLPTLQQKIHHEVQEGWQQVNANFTHYIKLIWVHDVTHIILPPIALADTTDPPLTLFAASTSSSHVCTQGASRLLLMSQAVVNAAIAFESSYFDMSDSLTELLLCAQSLNIYITKQIQKICKKGLVIT